MEYIKDVLSANIPLMQISLSEPMQTVVDFSPNMHKCHMSYINDTIQKFWMMACEIELNCMFGSTLQFLISQNPAWHCAR